MEHAEILKLEEKISGLIDYCQQKNEECTQLKKIVQEKKDRISELEQEIERFNQDRLEVMGRIESIVSRIDELNAQVAVSGADEDNVSE